MKEQSEKLFRAIGDVGDDLIARADAPVKKAPRVWVKWAALAACCALVIGAAAFVVPMFHAGSSAPETASAPTADTAAPEAPAEEEMEMTLEASEAPAEAMPEAAPAEPAEQKTRTLPGADCSSDLAHIGRLHADKRRRRCACPSQRVLAGDAGRQRMEDADIEPF